ncbi:ATP-binding cassette subfamily C protein/ATP-binding cassette subfamily C exporter for protease/lipase [Shimia isoporae]|uniref:ATP-binding cassette subfamily C protein/ATP-binding cassette subfamily C exporter for protease/lipase n=1 Tax=Shimia isoporae TaxID=647720 RepID=A0A4R1NM62_9RHOB|nr:ATP-binding cassette domain-containing protein [Shimia isoporae]TCL08811.1 ATP-binding cassette subfamily C protein/ATP-binding cassette subfamily C exporter for protease/lipase [Shimia isoporae]
MPNAAIGQLRRLIVPLFCLSLITNLAILVNPIFMMQVLDRVVPTGNLNTLAMLLIVGVGALALQASVEFIRDLCFQRAALWIEQSTIPAVMNTPAEERQSLIADRTVLTEALAGGTCATALTLPWIPLFLLVLWIIHPLFLLLALALTTFAAVIKFAGESLAGGNAQARSSLRQEEVETLRDADDVVCGSGMPAVFRNFWERWATLSNSRIHSLGETLAASVATTASAGFLRGVTQLLGLSLGAALVVSAELTAGGMIAASLILARTVANAEMAVKAWPELRAVRTAFDRLSLPRDHQSDIRTEIAELDGRLSCSGLIFPRGGGAPPRLDRVSFKLTPGQCLAIVGPSGGGKTTLLEALSGVAHCPIGSVLLDETDIKTLPIESLGKHVGYLPQQAKLFRGTLAENISGFAVNVDGKRVVAAAKTAGVHGLISALPESYDTDIGAHPHVLSAGQKQRVALARAIFSQPRYLFLDEPNALLDAAGERQLCAALARLKGLETTIVMNIHRSGLMGLADQVLALEKGRIADIGPRNEVLERMNSGHRRIELPLAKTALQDLTDWVGAQFTRSSDAEFARKAEVLARELFNLALLEKDADDVCAASFQFRFLSDATCEVSLIQDAPTQARSKMKGVTKLLSRSEFDLAQLAEDEAAMATISQMSDTFDIQSQDGTSVFRAALSGPKRRVNGGASH